MFDRDLFNSLRRLLSRKEIRIGLRYKISVSVLLSPVVKTKTKQCNVSTTTKKSKSPVTPHTPPQKSSEGISAKTYDRVRKIKTIIVNSTRPRLDRLSIE